MLPLPACASASYRAILGVAVLSLLFDLFEFYGTVHKWAHGLGGDGRNGGFKKRGGAFADACLRDQLGLTMKRPLVLLLVIPWYVFIYNLQAALIVAESLYRICRIEDI